MGGRLDWIGRCVGREPRAHEHFWLQRSGLNTRTIDVDPVLAVVEVKDHCAIAARCESPIRRGIVAQLQLSQQRFAANAANTVLPVNHQKCTAVGLAKRGRARHRFNLARSHLTIVAIAGNRSNRAPGSLKFDRSASAYCYHSPVVHELLITIRLPSVSSISARSLPLCAPGVASTHAEPCAISLTRSWR
jgi:hypothetical protein